MNKQMLLNELATKIGQLLNVTNEIEQGNRIDELMYLIVNINDDEAFDYGESLYDAIKRNYAEQYGQREDEIATAEEVMTDMFEDEYKLGER